MPWIKEELCVGCEICLVKCPVDAIGLNEARRAVIDDDICIRCGVCHEVCPSKAVRHDSELIPIEVEQNIDNIQVILKKHYLTPDERKSYLNRMMKHFKMRQKVLLGSMERLQGLVDELCDKEQ